MEFGGTSGVYTARPCLRSTFNVTNVLTRDVITSRVQRGVCEYVTLRNKQSGNLGDKLKKKKRGKSRYGPVHTEMLTKTCVQLRYDAVYIGICCSSLRTGASLLSEHTATLTIAPGSLYTDLETSFRFASYLAAGGGQNTTWSTGKKRIYSGLCAKEKLLFLL